MTTQIQLGIDSFATAFGNEPDGGSRSPSDSLRDLVNRIVRAEEAGLDVFGIGEHHRTEVVDLVRRLLFA